MIPVNVSLFYFEFNENEHVNNISVLKNVLTIFITDINKITKLLGNQQNVLNEKHKKILKQILQAKKDDNNTISTTTSSNSIEDNIQLASKAIFKMKQYSFFKKIIKKLLKDYENISLFSMIKLVYETVLLQITYNHNAKNIPTTTTIKKSKKSKSLTSEYSLQLYKIKTPYLPPSQHPKSVYTLILDMDETLIHTFIVNNIFIVF